MNQAFAFPKIEEVVVGGVDFVNVGYEETEKTQIAPQETAEDEEIHPEAESMPVEEVAAVRIIPKRELSETKVIKRNDEIKKE